MKILIFGFGLIGKKRAEALEKIFRKKKKDIFISDPFFKKHQYTKLLSLSNINFNEFKLIIIAVPHYQLFQIIKLLTNYKNILLIEKPLGKNYDEAMKIFNLLKNNSNNTYIGFNHRFYDGIQKIKDILEKEKDEIISIRINMGHGGSPQDKDSWKKNISLNGGGAIFDPGIHLIDLIRFFLKSQKISLIKKINWKGLWKFGGEEESVLLLKSKKVSIIQLHISLCKWLNEFSININTTKFNIILTGRTGNYGPQIIKVYKRWSWIKNSNKKNVPYFYKKFDEDKSFFNELKSIINKKTHNNCSLRNGLENMKIIDLIYKSK